ncbi:hypothetical protein ACFSHQ_07455 [Gemmobacter lanyuensis]
MRAPVILRATEGFTATLPGHRRDWLPLNSAQIVTEPLPPRSGTGSVGTGMRFWATSPMPIAIASARVKGGSRWAGAGCRIALARPWTDQGAGCRNAAPPDGDPAPSFPRRARGADRPWLVRGAGRAARLVRHGGFDPATGLGHAGGYVGVGVSTSNLAGRTLADLALRRDTALTRLPWVNRPVRRWEPEPLRWIGVHALYAALNAGIGAKPGWASRGPRRWRGWRAGWRGVS